MWKDWTDSVDVNGLQVRTIPFFQRNDLLRPNPVRLPSHFFFWGEMFRLSSRSQLASLIPHTTTVCIYVCICICIFTCICICIFTCICLCRSRQVGQIWRLAAAVSGNKLSRFHWDANCPIGSGPGSVRFQPTIKTNWSENNFHWQCKKKMAVFHLQCRKWGTRLESLAWKFLGDVPISFFV